MIVKDLLNKLDDLYPYDIAASWDNVGLLFGSKNARVEKVMTALNIDMQTCQKAVDAGCNVIVSHHPLLKLDALQSITKSEDFEGRNSIINDYYEGQLISYIIKNDLNVIAMHTNVDFANSAISTWIAQKLGYQVKESFVNESGGVVVEVNDTLKNVLENVKKFIGKNINYVGDLSKEISTAVIIGGSGSDFVNEFLYLGHDLLLTGDVTYHKYHYIASQGNGCCIADITHHMEIVFVNKVLETIDVEWCSFENEDFIKQY